MMRLFIALPLSADVRRYLGSIISDLKTENSPTRWVRSDNIHLTLRFLGDTPDKLVTDLCKLLDDVAKNHTTINSNIVSLGAFPNLIRPRVIWAGLEDEQNGQAGQDGIAQLVTLAKSVEDGVRTLGFDPENRPFRPHLTLARIKEHRDTGDISESVGRYSFSKIQLNLDRIILFKSTLTSKGPIYEALHTALFDQQ